MVVGFSSNFTEGYQNFTADDTLMLENVKQAITYAKQNKFIPNIDNSIKSQAQMPQDMEMMNKYMDKNPSNNNTLPTGNNINQSLNTEYTMPPSKQINNITMPTKNINNMPSMPTKNINNMPPMPTKNINNMSSMPTKNINNMPPMPTKNINNMSSMQQIPQNKQINNMTMPTKNINNMPPGKSSFKNISNNKNNIDDDEDDDDNDEEEEESDNEGYNDDDKDDDKTDVKKSLNTQSETRRQHMNNTDKDDDKDDYKNDIITEPFQGSTILEKQGLKRILLALLISFIAYLVVHMCMNNVIPINDISPQLKKFKNLIYGFLFFIITYLCLEIF